MFEKTYCPGSARVPSGLRCQNTATGVRSRTSPRPGGRVTVSSAWSLCVWTRRPSAAAAAAAACSLARLATVSHVEGVLEASHLHHYTSLLFVMRLAGRRAHLCCVFCRLCDSQRYLCYSYLWHMFGDLAHKYDSVCFFSLLGVDNRLF